MLGATRPNVLKAPLNLNRRTVLRVCTFSCCNASLSSVRRNRLEDRVFPVAAAVRRWKMPRRRPRHTLHVHLRVFRRVSNTHQSVKLPFRLRCRATLVITAALLTSVDISESSPSTSCQSTPRCFAQRPVSARFHPLSIAEPDDKNMGFNHRTL